MNANAKIDYFYGLGPELYEEYALCVRVMEADEALTKLKTGELKMSGKAPERRIQKDRQDLVKLLGYDPQQTNHHVRPKSKPIDLKPGMRLINCLDETYEVVFLSAHPRVKGDDNLVTYKDGQGRLRTRSIASLFGHLPSGTPVVRPI